MKKIIASAAAILLACAAMPAATAFAADSADVYVTIADAQGKLALTQEKITVTDIDDDGALTINDALYCTHEEKYEGGASAGYASAEGSYGLSVTKLWGTENGGSYGYYVNQTMAMGLSDAIADGDYLDAFVYTDLSAWSDAYCWFDVRTAEAQTGEALELTLSYQGFDADWAPVTLPVAGAVITIDGEETAFTTDADGKVSITFDAAGEKLVSAKSATQTLVPPAVIVTVTGETGTAETTTSTEETATTTTTMTTQGTTSTTTTMTTTKATAPVSTTTAAGTVTSPGTSDASGVGAAIVLAGAAAALAALTVSRKHEEN